MPQTRARARATFLLEVALDQERIKQRVGDLLREHRRKLGYPQERVAPLFGVSFRTYQRWEGAEVMPRWSQMETIAEQLGVDVSEIVGEQAHAPPLVETEPLVPPAQVIVRLEAASRQLTATTDRLEELLDALPEMERVATLLVDLRAELEQLAQDRATNAPTAAGPPALPRRGAAQ